MAPSRIGGMVRSPIPPFQGLSSLGSVPGPHETTGRVADISPGLMEALDIETDDEVEVIYPAPVLP